MKREQARKTIHWITIITGILSIVFIIYGMKTHLFSSEQVLQSFLDRFGLWAPIIFILLQAIQVVFPIIPGGIGLLGGVLVFGPLYGFIYNYIGICLGSMIAFLLSKHYGAAMMKVLFSEKLHNKYVAWADDQRFTGLFAVAIFMPIAPDDFLCYLAGTTNMKFSRFATIILLGKPLAIAAYSFGLGVFFKHLIPMFT